MHKLRLKNVRKLVDTSEPHAVRMDHVRNNLKKEQMLEERYSEIDHENHILLKKMSHIMGPQGNEFAQGSPRPAEKRPPGPTSLNRDSRKKELLRITKDNQSILKRIQQAQPVVNHVELEGSHKRCTNYLRNCAEYPLVLRTPRSARGGKQTSELVPLEQQPMPWRSARPSSLPPPQRNQPLPPPREDYQEEQQIEDGLKYVAKESRRLGDKYYLIEMATDAAGALHISAYDGEAQEQLELPLKEKAHRRLVRETDGDYAAVASRLTVATDATGGRRLALLDEPPKEAAQKAPPQPSQDLDAEEMIARAGSAGASSVNMVGGDMRSTFEGFAAKVELGDTIGDSSVRFRGLTASTDREGGRS